MFINFILEYLQNIFLPFYKKSFILQNIDWLIFVNLILLILTSTFLSSDSISYLAIFIIILSVTKIIVKPNEKIRFTLADKFLLLYFIFLLISLAGSTLFVLSLKGFFKTLLYLGFYAGFVNYLKDNKSHIKYILLFISLALIGESVIAIKQNFLSVSEISGWQDISRLNPEEVMTRVYGSIKPYNPNLFGGYILAILPSSLILFFLPLINKHYRISLVGLSVFILGLLTLIMTGCRGAYIGLFVELMLIIILTYRFLKPFYKKIFLFMTGIFSSIVCLLILSSSSLKARIFSIFAMRGDSSNSFRFNVYNSCIEMFKDNWLLGIGIGNQNFREIYGLYMKTGFDALSAYNIYLEIALESGIFALLAFLAFIIVNLSRAFISITSRSNINSVYLAIASVSIIGLLVHGIVDTVFFRPQIQFIFWMMIGMVNVLSTPRTRRCEEIKRI